MTSWVLDLYYTEMHHYGYECHSPHVSRLDITAQHSRVLHGASCCFSDYYYVKPNAN
jgi:hypothetical protein